MPHRWRLVRDVVAALAIVSAAVLLVSRYVAVPWVVGGGSMEPTLRAGDRVIVELWTYRWRGPRVGDVALFTGPDGRPMVKRVVRGPFRFRHTPGFRSEDPAEERYEVEGDNPEASTDSRLFGAVPRRRFRGRVTWRYWPPSRAGPVR